MNIEQEALEFERITKLTFEDPWKALSEIGKIPSSTELSFLRYAVIGLAHLHLKQQRRPRLSKPKMVKR